jgi:hypothetical protein
VWKRFRAAADRFFERYHNRHTITLAAKLAEREALVVALERLAASDTSALPEDLAARVQELRTTWNRSVPIPVAEMKALIDRWQTALAQLVSVAPAAFTGTDLDPATVLRRMEKLVSRVESHLGSLQELPRGLSHTEMLAAQLRSALATNAMGGRASEESKWRAALDAVKDAQVAWQRLAPMSGPEAAALSRRFRDACRKVTERARRQTSQPRRTSQERQERHATAV